MTMKPQLFVEASVSFVVIYNFAYIVSKMTPVQIVDLINHLWIIFDDVAAKHNVYKVGRRKFTPTDLPAPELLGSIIVITLNDSNE